jgi:hypothetical protein
MTDSEADRQQYLAQVAVRQQARRATALMFSSPIFSDTNTNHPHGIQCRLDGYSDTASREAIVLP